MATTLIFASAAQATPILGCGVAGFPTPYTVNCDQSVSSNVNSGPYTATYRHNGSLFIGFDNAPANSKYMIDQFVNAQRYGQYSEHAANGAALMHTGIEFAGDGALLVSAVRPAPVEQPYLSNHSAAPVTSLAAAAPVKLAQTALVAALGDEGVEIFEDTLAGTDAAFAGVLIDNGITEHISTIMINSGGNLPGLGANSLNLAYYVLPVSEPDGRWLWIVALPLLILSVRRRDLVTITRR